MGKVGNRGGTGRPRKSAMLHLMQGTFRKGRHENLGPVLKPTGDGRLPPPPKDLSDEVRAAWIELAAPLQFRIFSVEDVRSFHAFSVMWAQWRAVADHVMKHGVRETVETKHGTTVRMAPEAQVWLSLNSQLLTYFSRFGMTPADRSRVREVETTDAKQENPDDEFGQASA